VPISDNIRGDLQEWEHAGKCAKPLQAWLAGRVIPLGPPRQQAVLGLLAANLGSIVRRETIIDALWGAEAPPTSTAVISAYVSRLRTILGVGRDGLRHHFQSGYQLVAGAAQVDMVSFSRLARHARTALDLGQSADACGLYEQALALWRGEALAGLDLLRTHPSVTRLQGSGPRRSCTTGTPRPGWARTIGFSPIYGSSPTVIR
jgi:Transcriptional regulatory protein, C terminal/Bacterial transcriptional activator domain